MLSDHRAPKQLLEKLRIPSFGELPFEERLEEICGRNGLRCRIKNIPDYLVARGVTAVISYDASRVRASIEPPRGDFEILGFFNGKENVFRFGYGLSGTRFYALGVREVIDFFESHDTRWQ